MNGPVVEAREAPEPVGPIVSTVRFVWLNQPLSQIWQAGGPCAQRHVDVTPYPRSIFDRQQRPSALNTRRALCIELAESSLLALEWQELAAG